jgi:hypothetical protein
MKWTPSLFSRRFEAPSKVEHALVLMAAPQQVAAESSD